MLRKFGLWRKRIPREAKSEVPDIFLDPKTVMREVIRIEICTETQIQTHANTHAPGICLDSNPGQRSAYSTGISGGGEESSDHTGMILDF